MSDSVNKGGFDKDTFIQSADDYIELLRAYINKENMVLYPFGDRMFLKEQQTRLFEAFDKFEEEVMGKDAHERLTGSIEKFEAKYL